MIYSPRMARPTTLLPIVTPFAATLIVAAALYAGHAAADRTRAQEYALYTNDRWHFSIAVPAGSTAVEHDRPGGKQIVMFTGPNSNDDFEIIAEPYTQLDVALGTEGAPDTGTDQPTTLGVINAYHDDIYSVSFHRNAIAYTVSSGALSAETWLLPILQSWEFTD